MDSPFLFNAPTDTVGSQHPYGYAGDQPHRSALPSFGTLPNSLANLTMPVWPVTDDDGKDDLLGGRSNEGTSNWHTSNVRPFTAPASAYHYSSYSPDDDFGSGFASTSQIPHMPFTEFGGQQAGGQSRPFRMGDMPLSAAPTYHRPSLATNHRQMGDLSDESGHSGSASPFAFMPSLAPGTRSFADQLPNLFWGSQPQLPRPATISGALYGGLSRIVEPVQPPPQVPDPIVPQRRRPSTATTAVSSPPFEDAEDSEEPFKPKKRPRRKHDQIERLYTCNYPDCPKGYGTLNHLNAHVTMQKHGPKRMPAEFKEMRKAWKERKKAQDAKRERVALEQERREEERAFAGEDDEEDEWRSPTPPASVAALLPPTTDEDDPFAFQPPPLLSAGASLSSTGIRSSVSMAYPMPIRPQTAPSTETLSLLLQQASPQLPTYRAGPTLTGSLGGYEQVKGNMWARRTSLPNAQYLPTLHETAGEQGSMDGMGVYS